MAKRKIDIEAIAKAYDSLVEKFGEDAGRVSAELVFGDEMTAAGTNLDAVLNEARAASFGNVADLVGGLLSVETFLPVTKREDMCPSFQRRVDVAQGFASSVYKTSTWALATIKKLRTLDASDVAATGVKATPIEKVQTSGNVKPLKGVEATVEITEALLETLTHPDAEAYFARMQTAFEAVLSGGMESPWGGAKLPAGAVEEAVAEAVAEAVEEIEDAPNDLPETE